MSFVYFIKPVGMPGPIKIGCSYTPYNRLDALKCWSPWPLEVVAIIPGNYGLESKIHGHFLAHHSHKEWFHAAPDILILIEKLKAGVPIGEIIDLGTRTGSIRKRSGVGASLLWTPSRRLLMGYVQRIRWAEEKLKRRLGVRLVVTQHLSDIIGRWRGSNRFPSVSPTDAELAELDTALADPAQHFISAELRWPKQEAA